MSKKIVWLGVVAFLIVVGIVAYLLMMKPIRSLPPEMPLQMAPPPPPPEVTTPPIRHPLESAPVVEPLPLLEQSDVPLLKALGGFLGARRLALFYTDNVIHRIVATVDNLPRRDLPAGVVPLKRVPLVFITKGKEDSLTISPRNSARYSLYIKLVRELDAAKLVALYVKFYPLFQRAYVELGYPKGYFNDRLVEAIDDLLAAPDLAGPIKLDQPGVLYEFADAELEKRSSGQKIMLRIGRGNSDQLKAKLREIRKLITGGSGPS